MMKRSKILKKYTFKLDDALQFAEFHVLRAHMPHVLTFLCALLYACLCTLHAYVSSCLCILHVYVPTCFCLLQVLLPTRLCFSRTYLPTYLSVLRAYVFYVHVYVCPNVFLDYVPLGDKELRTSLKVWF